MCVGRPLTPQQHNCARGIHHQHLDHAGVASLEVYGAVDVQASRPLLCVIATGMSFGAQQLTPVARRSERQLRGWRLVLPLGRRRLPRQREVGRVDLTGELPAATVGEQDHDIAHVPPLRVHDVGI
jgi:hypothetical protein